MYFPTFSVIRQGVLWPVLINGLWANVSFSGWENLRSDMHPLWASQVALVVKNLPANTGRHKRHKFYPWIGKIPCKRAWQPASVFLPGESHGQKSLGATVHRVAKSQTRLKQLSMHASSVSLLPYCAVLGGQVFQMPQIENRGRLFTPRNLHEQKHIFMVLSRMSVCYCCIV